MSNEIISLPADKLIHLLRLWVPTPARMALALQIVDAVRESNPQFDRLSFLRAVDAHPPREDTD